MIGMDPCSCIIHYDFLSTSDKMTRLSEVSFKTLTECKKIRESLGGENHHEDQCKGIPAASFERRTILLSQGMLPKIYLCPSIAQKKIGERK
jgi:hypothetical protein